MGRIKDIISPILNGLLLTLFIGAIVFLSTVISETVYPQFEGFMIDFDLNDIIKVRAVNDTIIYQKENVTITYTLENLINGCSLFDYGEEQVNCINAFVRKHYKFIEDNPSDDLREIFENGTNCVGYSSAYQQILEEMGYNYKAINICFPKGDRGDRGYCLLDQKIKHCLEFPLNKSDTKQSCHRFGVVVY